MVKVDCPRCAKTQDVIRNGYSTSGAQLLSLQVLSEKLLIFSSA
ncbi:IS1 family transposase [Edwardsiella tarda]